MEIKHDHRVHRMITSAGQDPREIRSAFMESQHGMLTAQLSETRRATVITFEHSSARVLDLISALANGSLSARTTTAFAANRSGARVPVNISLG